MATNQVYEQPLNERIRSFLKFETLVTRLIYFTKQSHNWCAYQALLSLLEITALIERGDIKQESIKEIDRQQAILKELSQLKGVNKNALEAVLTKLFQASQTVHSINGKMGEHIKSVDFLLALKQRTSIPGGSCDFDLPELHFWLSQNATVRAEDIHRWSVPYLEIYHAVSLLLKVIRDSGHASKVIAQSGFYQENLDSHQSNQLLRISIPKTEAFFPEISAGKQRYSIRLLTKPNFDNIATQLKDDIEIKLIRCVL